MNDSNRVQYKFMIPADLKAELEACAAQSRRSLSAEIIVRLTESVRNRNEVSDDPLLNERDMLQDELQYAEVEVLAASARIVDIQRRMETIEQAIASRTASADS